MPVQACISLGGGDRLTSNFSRKNNPPNHCICMNPNETKSLPAPYNRALLYKYRSHINVEVCSTLYAVKYLHKYIYKGGNETITHDVHYILIKKKILSPENLQKHGKNLEKINQYQLSEKFIFISISSVLLGTRTRPRNQNCNQNQEPKTEPGTRTGTRNQNIFSFMCTLPRQIKLCIGFLKIELRWSLREYPIPR